MIKDVVIDTSAFIAYFRGDDADLVPLLILQNSVLLSPVVRLELISGVRRSETKAVESVLDGLRHPEDFPPVKECEVLLKRAKGSGLFGGIADLLIIADAHRHKAALYTLDQKMAKLAKLLGVRVLANAQH